MKKNVSQDERIEAQNRKIGSDTCYLLMFTLFVSILIQQYSLNAPFSQYAVEVIALLGAAIYIVARNVMLGNLVLFREKSGKRGIISVSVACGILVTAINGILNHLRYAEQYNGNRGLFAATLAVTFVSATAISFVPLFVAYLFNKRKRKAIDELLDNEENSIG